MESAGISHSSGQFRGEALGHTFQPTALGNEAFLRLASVKSLDWNDRSHFFAVAARIMRRYPIDCARAKPEVDALGSVGLPERIVGQHNRVEFALALDSLLDELSRESPRQVTVVELKFLVGLTDGETAEAMGIPQRTVEREWHRARRWLFGRLETAP